MNQFLNKKLWIAALTFCVIVAAVTIVLSRSIPKTPVLPENINNGNSSGSDTHPQQNTQPATGSTSSEKGPRTLADQNLGFSLSYPATVFLKTYSDEPGQYYLQSTPGELDLGGAAPDTNAPVETSGYVISIIAKDITQPFDINQWITSQYPNSTVDKVLQIKVSGGSAYKVTFKDEIGAGEPYVFVPHNGKVFELDYSSSYGEGTSKEQEGLNTFASILQSFHFTK